MNSKYVTFLTVFAIFLSGFLAGYFFAPNSQKEEYSDKFIQKENSEENYSEYQFLSRRILAENTNDVVINFVPLRSELREYIEKIPDETGLYFEYLPSGTSIGINDQLNVNIASLVKIPIVIAVYHKIDKGEIKKDDFLTLSEKNIDKKFGDFWKKGVGTKITIKEVVDLSLTKSDNTASNMLLSLLTKGEINEVFDYLDIPMDIKDELHIISPKNYSSILRSLYLSSYLEKDSSNEILEILSRTDFQDKIPKDIPKTVMISHKIGVFNSAKNPESMYSDCGIIYVPKRPYLLCIMSKSNEEKSREYMSHISKMIYGYVINMKK